MIVATVTTCPQRWNEYQKLRADYTRLGVGCDLRTFQTTEERGNARLNANLNARAALAYGASRLSAKTDWLLYLEDDIRLFPELPRSLEVLCSIGEAHVVDCWYLCNRKNPASSEFQLEGLALKELAFPVYGTHALLLPQRHLSAFLNGDWRAYADNAIFSALQQMRARVWQIVHPVLVEHLGEYSTFEPGKRKKIEVNYASASNCHSTN